MISLRPLVVCWLPLALLLLASSGGTTALCVEGNEDLVGNEAPYKRSHEHVNVGIEEEEDDYDDDYDEDYLGDVMEPVDFPDGDEEDEDDGNESRGSGKKYLRLLHGAHGDIDLCPHLKEYLEMLEG